MRRIFFDTEFTNLTSDAKLISIGLVGESCNWTFYAELSDTWRLSDASDFTVEVVIPLLEGGEAILMTKRELGEKLGSWIKRFEEPVVLATDSLNWDWPWILDIFRHEGTWPQNLAREPLLLTMNYLNAFDAFEVAIEAAFASGLRRHHALDDALANRLGWFAAGGDILMEEVGLTMLKERHRKDAEDVAAGRRSPRSLFMFHKDDLKGFTFTENPQSEFKRGGDGW